MFAAAPNTPTRPNSSSADLTLFLDALIDLVEPVDVWFLWRPQLRDPGDELVLEAAVNGRADAIATFNRRDFRPAADRFGIDILLPAEAIQRISMTTRTSTYPLRLPVSIKIEAEKLAAAEGTSLNQFVATAVAEKVAALRTASYFAERRGRADWEAFDRLMNRSDGEPPRSGDEMP